MSPLLTHMLAEKCCLEALLAHLDQEDKAISECRFAELPSITEQKAGLLDRIAQLDRERESAQVALGFDPGRAGAEVAVATGDETLRQTWLSMLALAVRARDLNRRIGARVYTHLDFTQKAIGFLKARDQPIYGPDGIQETPRGGGSRLALG